MKSISSIFLLSIVCLFFSCSDTGIDDESVIDFEGPNIYNIRWTDYLDRSSSYSEPIVVGGEYVKSIESGYRMHMKVWDKSIIKRADLYALVNNDPNIRNTLISGDIPLESNEFSMGFGRESDIVWLKDGGYYKLQPGDRFHFYASFTDEFGNMTSMYWTVDFIE